MNHYSYNTQPGEPALRDIWGQAAVRMWDQMQNRRGLIFGLILVVALTSFEIFNFSTTDYALTDLLGNLTFVGLRWATILAVAFCGIDFAGLARLFTPERGQSGYTPETWYLIGAWFLGATMNAMMTWWAVSLAMLNGTHQIGNEIMSREQLLAYVPVFVAALVWLTRILIIGTFSMAGHRLFSQAEAVLTQVRDEARAQHYTQRPQQPARPASAAPTYSQRPAPAPRPASAPTAKVIGGTYESDEDNEPVYVPLDSRPRPASTTPPPAAAIRPAEPYRSPTRPAPKPQPQLPSRNGDTRPNEYGNGNGNGNGHSNGNGNGNSKW